MPPGGATGVEHGTGVYHGRGPRLAIASRQHIWLMDARYLRAPVHHWRTPLLSEPIDNADENNGEPMMWINTRHVTPHLTPRIPHIYR